MWILDIYMRFPESRQPKGVVLRLRSNVANANKADFEQRTTVASTFCLVAQVVVSPGLSDPDPEGPARIPSIWQIWFRRAPSIERWYRYCLRSGIVADSLQMALLNGRSTLVPMRGE